MRRAYFFSRPESVAREVGVGIAVGIFVRLAALAAKTITASASLASFARGGHGRLEQELVGRIPFFFLGAQRNCPTAQSAGGSATCTDQYATGSGPARLPSHPDESSQVR